MCFVAYAAPINTVHLKFVNIVGKYLGSFQCMLLTC